MSPLRYAALYGQRIGCLSPDLWSYNPALYAWLKELLAVLRQYDEIERYREEMLTPEELAQVRLEQADIEKNGF